LASWCRPGHAAEPFPSLSIAVSRASERASALIAARGAERAAGAMDAGARLSPLANPYLEVFADRGVARDASEATVQSNLWLPLEISGQRRRRIEAVRRLATWRAGQSELIQAETIARLVQRYGLAVVAAERTRFLEKMVVISQQEAALYDARVQAGDATVRDARLAAVDLSRNRMALAEARADLARALAEVAVVTGTLELAAPEQAQPPPPALWTAVEQDPERSIDSGPALKALRLEGDYFDAAQARDAVESYTPLSVILSGGRAANGAARLGGGLAWTFPLLRRNQGERARAHAERERAIDVAIATRREQLAMLHGLYSERTEVSSALRELRVNGEPAAQAAVDAALQIARAGKGELLHVVTARRDLISVRVSGLALEEREWSLLSRLVALTGRTP
jgi:cobalt-zinc-cadmium efflux system outer membrane protein